MSMEQAVDAHTAARTDYTTDHDSTTDLNQTEDDGVHQVRLQYDDIAVSDSDVNGKVVFSVSLDTTLDEIADTMSTQYEFYSIHDLVINVQATSPLGVSSGALQICHIPDPRNTGFYPTTDARIAQNVDKIVRQEGSVIGRPRDTLVLKVPLSGVLYTYRSGDPRFWSYGTVAMVIRHKPAAGDSIRFAVTVSCRFKFSRLTYRMEQPMPPPAFRIPTEFDSTTNTLVYPGHYNVRRVHCQGGTRVISAVPVSVARDQFNTLIKLHPSTVRVLRTGGYIRQMGMDGDMIEAITIGFEA